MLQICSTQFLPSSRPTHIWPNCTGEESASRSHYRKPLLCQVSVSLPSAIHRAEDGRPCSDGRRQARDARLGGHRWLVGGMEAAGLEGMAGLMLQNHRVRAQEDRAEGNEAVRWGSGRAQEKGRKGDKAARCRELRGVLVCMCERAAVTNNGPESTIPQKQSTL